MWLKDFLRRLLEHCRCKSLLLKAPSCSTKVSCRGCESSFFPLDNAHSRSCTSDTFLFPAFFYQPCAPTDWWKMLRMVMGVDLFFSWTSSSGRPFLPRAPSRRSDRGGCIRRFLFLLKPSFVILRPTNVQTSATLWAPSTRDCREKERTDKCDTRCGGMTSGRNGWTGAQRMTDIVFTETWAILTSCQGFSRVVLRCFL